ncbi:MAG TPA: DUF302 domain-containing protein [Gammaproteobacteria bacterium]|nr:DUF302 domain-containing protein [Gammaproteobacteria bacterium]
MNRLLAALVAAFFLLPVAWAGDGLVTVKSAFSVPVTLDRFEDAVREKGMRVFARVDHSKGAAGVSMQLRPTVLLIFGNPKIGTLLMQSNQNAGIDLPLKVLAREDENGDVWLVYNDPAYIASRHGITDRDPVIAKMSKALQGFAAAATAE